MVDIAHATASYEKWMRGCTAVISSDLQSKHEQMRESPFLLLRGTFHRWAQLWPSVCSDLAARRKSSRWETCTSTVLEPGATQRGVCAGGWTTSTNPIRWPIRTTSC